MNKICNVLKKFAQFYLFTTQQKLKYCQLVDEIFLKISSFRHKAKISKYSVEKEEVHGKLFSYLSINY